MGAVGKLPTDTNSNSKPYKKAKLDYGGGSRSMHMTEDKDAVTTKEHCLVAKVLSMTHNLGDCSVPHRGLGRLMCRMTCRTRQQSAGCCRRNRRQRHQARLSACARALHAHLQTGEGYSSTAYLTAYTAA